MAKIYKVIPSDSRLNSSDSDWRYVGIRSNANEKWIASPINSGHIKVEKINVSDALDEDYKKKYNFIFEVNAADYSNFLNVANAKKGILSYKNMDDSENLAKFLKKLEDKGLKFETQNELSTVRKLSIVSSTSLSSEKDAEIESLESASLNEIEPDILPCQFLTEKKNALLSQTQINKQQQQAVNEFDRIKKGFKDDENELAKLNSSFEQIRKKEKKIRTGLTRYFFKTLSREKTKVLDSVLKNFNIVEDFDNFIRSSDFPDESNLKAIKSKLADINNTLSEENLKILQKARGLTFFGLRKVTTTSDQIALEVKKAANDLEEKIDKLVSQVSVVNSI